MKDDELLANALVEEDVDSEPARTAPPLVKLFDGWWPDLNPTQLLIFNDNSPVVFGIGEKGSGKTVAFLHRLVRHCYENFNALAYIIAPTQSSGYEGAGHDLVTLVLPAWRDGNREAAFVRQPDGSMAPNPRSGELKDSGIGLQYTEWKLDPVTKDRHLWIQNRYGRWSKVVLKSILFPAQVEARVKGPAPSLIYLEEATNCEGKEYFTFPRAQLGRRRYITGTQQYLASCNPDDPENWVHKLLYEECVDKNGKAWPKDRESPGIKRDVMFAVYDVPYQENIHRLGSEYRRNLESTFRSDPILWARLIEGKWVAYPSGVALFKLHFSEGRHVHGDERNQRGMRPLRGYPLVLGYDLGKVNTGIQFLQCLETEHGPFWINYDNFCYYQEKIPSKLVARALLEKMVYWCRLMEYDFEFRHISDNSAFNQFNHSTGSTDALELFNNTKKIIADNPHRFGRLSPVRLIECPKPPGSVEERVSILMDLLRDDQFAASSTCHWTRSMLLHLERADDNVMEPKKPSKYSHSFDSITYPMFFRKHVATKGFREHKESAVQVST